MSTTAITTEINEHNLAGYTDERLALYWHLAQANPADGFDDSRPGELAARIGWEIIRRWLRAAPTEMYNHQQRHYYWHQLSKFAIYRPGAEDFHDGHWEPRAVPDTKELREALAAKLAELGAFAGTLSREQIAQELTRIVLPGPAGQHNGDGGPGDQTSGPGAR